MRVIISGLLLVFGLVFGFISGVLYDQATVVLLLQRETKTHQERADLYLAALDACTKNKFKSKDYLLDQARLINKIVGE